MRYCCTRCPLRPIVLLRLVLLLLNSITQIEASSSLAKGALCSLQNIVQHLRQPARDDYIFYGITQDCQIFFGTRHQAEELKEIYVNLNVTTCYPNLVKLHLRRHGGAIGLVLFVRQSGNRICVLPIDLPEHHTLVGPRLFRYSLQSAITYAPCSQLPDKTFDLEPDLSFLDTTFSDVVYFINARSSGGEWKVRQFQIDDNNQFKALDRLTLKHQVIVDAYGLDLASEYEVELDPRYAELYTMHRFSKTLQSQCSFDALFRPERSEPKSHHFDVQHGMHGRSKWVDAFSIDGDLLIYAESLREPTGRSSTDIYIADIDANNRRSSCIAHVSYVLDIGFVLQRTLDELRLNPLPVRGSSAYPPSPRQHSFTKYYSNQTMHATVSTPRRLVTTTRRTTTTGKSASTTRPAFRLSTDATTINKEKFSISVPEKSKVPGSPEGVEKSGESAIGKMEGQQPEKSAERSEEIDVEESTGRPRAGQVGEGRRDEEVILPPPSAVSGEDKEGMMEKNESALASSATGAFFGQFTVICVFFKTF